MERLITGVEHAIKNIRQLSCTRRLEHNGSVSDAGLVYWLKCGSYWWCYFFVSLLAFLAYSIVNHKGVTEVYSGGHVVNNQ